MKKWIAMLLALTLCLTLSACGGGEEDQELDLGAVREKVSALEWEGEPLFPQLTEPGAQELKDVYGIDISLCEKYLVGISDQGFYMVCLPKEGEGNALKNNIAQALKDLSAQNSLYEPEQAALIENRMETLRGEALIYIASRDNTAVLDAIDAAMEESNG